MTETGLESPAQPSRLAQDSGLHRDLIGQARRPDARPYLSSGIAAPGQTFGVEIEFCGADKDVIKGELATLGLGDWNVKYEIDAHGGEISSPILTDTPKAWDDLATVCSVIRKHGGYVDHRAGGHIHVGVASSGITDRFRQLKSLLSLYAWSEDLLFRMSAASGSEPFHRSAISRFGYVYPIAPVLERAKQAASEEQLLGEVTSYRGMTYRQLTYGGQTVEFRVNDATLDPERWQANIMVDCALMRAAATLSDEQVPQRTNLLGTHISKGRTDDRLLREFSDLVLLTPEQRLKAYSVYLNTEWQAAMDDASGYVRKRMNTAVSIEMTRIRRHLGTQARELSRKDQKALRYFVDPNTHNAPELDGASQLAQSAARWWLRQPLHHGAPLATRWNLVRSSRSASLLHEEAQQQLVEALGRNSGRVPSDAEGAWLREMTSPEGATAEMSPTRAAAAVYEEWMREEPSAADLRNLRQIQQRWRSYHLDLVGEYRDERNRVAAQTEQLLARALTAGEEQLLSVMVASHGSEEVTALTTIPDRGFLESMTRVLATSSDATLWTARGKTLEAIRPYLVLADAYQEILQQIEGGDGGPATPQEQEWMSTMMLAGRDDPERRELPATPSERALEAFLAWRSAPSGAGAWVWNEYGDAVAKWAEQSWTDQRFQACKQSEFDGIVAEFRAATGRDPRAQEATWLHAVVGTPANSLVRGGALPSDDAHDVARIWLQREVPADAPNRDQWQQRRESVLQVMIHGDAVRRLIDRVVAEAGDGSPLAGAERSWLFRWLESTGDEDPPPPTRRTIAVADAAVVLYQGDATPWHEIHPVKWQNAVVHLQDHSTRDSWISAASTNELLEQYMHLPNVAGRSARQRAADVRWLERMTKAEQLSQPVRQLDRKDRPSAMARALFASWIAEASTPDDTTGWPAVIQQNWTEWQTAEISTRELKRIATQLGTLGTDQPEQVAAWIQAFGLLTSGFATVPSLSAASKQAIAQWVESAPSGAEIPAQAFDAERRRRWERCQDIWRRDAQIDTPDFARRSPDAPAERESGEWPSSLRASSRPVRGFFLRPFRSRSAQARDRQGPDRQIGL